MPATKTFEQVGGVPVPTGVGLEPGVGVFWCAALATAAAPQTAEATEKSCVFLVVALYSPIASLVPSLYQIFPDLSAVSRWGAPEVAIFVIVMDPVKSAWK